MIETIWAKTADPSIEHLIGPNPTFFHALPPRLDANVTIVVVTPTIANIF
jgi:hypothetical protein